MISVDDIKKLATLARIELSADEEQKLASDMENILGYVQQIQTVTGLPESHTERIRNVLRPDTKPHESGIFTEDILAEAPKREGQFVKVKKIL